MISKQFAKDKILKLTLTRMFGLVSCLKYLSNNESNLVSHSYLVGTIEPARKVIKRKTELS